MRSFFVHRAVCAAACSFVLSTLASSQPSSDPQGIRPVITIDGRQIGTKEFESRLNYFSVGYPKDERQKKQFVALALIQEELLAGAARDAHLDTLAQVRSVSHQFEKEASYEAWMNREITSKVTISDDDVNRAYALYKQQRVVNYRIYADSNSARRALPRFRSMLAGKTAPADTLTKTKAIEYGEANKNVEDAVFTMKPGDTRIVRSDGKWYLFSLKAVEPHPTRSKQSLPAAYNDLLKLIHREKELQLLGTKMSEIMAGHNIKLARQAREHLYRLLAERIPFSNPRITKFPEIVNQEIGQKLPPETDMKETFLTYKDGTSMTLGQFWNLISTGPYLLNFRSPGELRGGIDYLIRRVIIVETVAAAASRLGLDRSPYVQEQRSMWTDNLLSNLFQFRLSQHEQPTQNELDAEAQAYKGSPSEIRERVLQEKTHAAIDSVLNYRVEHASISVDTTALYRAHAIEGDLVVRKDHFPNRFVVPHITPANPDAAWAIKLMRAWGE